MLVVWCMCLMTGAAAKLHASCAVHVSGLHLVFMSVGAVHVSVDRSCCYTPCLLWSACVFDKSCR